MDHVFTIAEERLNLFARMANSACGLSLWCFGMKKQLYTCTCPAEKEFRLFLDLGQCLDYAIAHGPESHAPILMSDPIGMLWVAECVWHGDDAGYLVILGPVFDAAASWQTLQNCLRGMNLSVSLTATIMEKLEQVPILPLSTLHMLTSGMTGYVPNKSDSAVSDAPDRPFVSIGDPHADDASHASFNSQISQVFKVPGKRDLYIALADRWVPDYPVDAKLADLLERCTAQRFDPEHYKATSEEMQTMMQSPMLTSANTSRANYVWLPITFEEGKPKIYWRDSWKLSDFE